MGGQEMDNFAGMGRAATTVFQILLGDFDYSELSLVGRLDTAIWFVSFMLLVNLIMLNMLLAIVLDRYTEVKGPGRRLRDALVSGLRALLSLEARKERRGPSHGD